MLRSTLIALIASLLACAPSGSKGNGGGGDTALDGDPSDSGDSGAEGTPAGVVDVPPSGPYGAHTFSVPARANWVNTGLYLRAGQIAEISATGEWSVDGEGVGPEGASGRERGCIVGSLVARSGLRFEEDIECIGAGATFTATTDDILYVGMIYSTDLGETYASRLGLDGSLEVTVTSDGDTVPTIAAADLSGFPFDTVSSGWVELQSEHHLVTIEASEVVADLDVAADSLSTLDDIYEVEADMRGDQPYSGGLVRWYPDATITDFAYMLAGNPTRCDPSLMNGGQTQRILRAAEGTTDIWGFSHELGHSFTMANGAWVYMYVNLESWPNLFTLRALDTLDRTEDQPNFDSYCDGRDAYFADPVYETLADDPFLQLCFLMDFDEAYGPTFYDDFFDGLSTQTNDDVRYDGTDASVWRYVRDRFDLAAGEDTTPIFERWGVPLDE